MERTNPLETKAPPKLIPSLIAGFDAITNHIELILFPLAFDLLLWLGPHLRISNLINDYIDQMGTLSVMNEPDMTELVHVSQEFWMLVAERFNLISLFRSYPIGIPSLMVSRQPINAPLNFPTILEMPSFLSVILIVLMLTITGLFGGTIYFAGVSQAALKEKLDWLYIIRKLPGTFLHVLLLALLWLAIIFAVSIPGSCLVTVMSLGGALMSQIGIFMYGGLIMWLLFPLLFSPHGIFSSGSEMWISLRQGVRITRATVFTTGLFFISAFVLNEGLDMLWRVPEETSWLAIVGVVGHGFVTTGLIAASFVYYNDANNWLKDSS